MTTVQNIWDNGDGYDWYRKINYLDENGEQFRQVTYFDDNTSMLNIELTR